MNSRERDLFRKSRDIRTLISIFLGVLALGFAAALVFSALGFRPGVDLGQKYIQALQDDDSEAALALVDEAIEDAGDDPAEFVKHLRSISAVHEFIAAFKDVKNPVGADPETELRKLLKFSLSQAVIGRMDSWPLKPEQKELFKNYVAARSESLFGILRSGKDGNSSEGDAPEVLPESPAPGGLAKLRRAAEAPSPLPFARELLADVLQDEGDFEQAYRYYSAEADARPDAVYPREQMMRIALKLDDEQRLRELTQDSDFTNKIPAGLMYEYRRDQGEWGLLLWECVRLVVERLTSGMIVLALLAGVIWFVVILKAGGVVSVRNRTVGVCAIGVLLGMLSVAPTLWAIAWQEDVWGIAHGDRIVDGVVFYVGGVGLREEFCKLLMFVPLALFLVRRGDNMEMLLAATCTGLGFAITENVGYFHRSDPGSAAIARFLTANFAHMFLTGLIGFAFCKMVQSPKKWFDHFLFVFVLYVILHGVYDLFLGFGGYSDAGSLNRLMSFPFISFILFIVYSRQYFHQFDAVRDDSVRHIISPMAVFTTGLALLFALAYNYASFLAGPYNAFLLTGMAATGLFPMAYFFYKYFERV